MRDPSEIAVDVLIVVTAISVLLVLATIVRKIRRDRRTLASRQRRDLLAASLNVYRANPASPVASQLPEILAKELSSRMGRRDLLAFLGGCNQDDRALMGEMARTEVAIDLLVRDTTKRAAWARGTAILLLALLGAEEAAPAATKALDDADSDVRLVSVHALSLVPPGRGVPALFSALRAGKLASPRIVERLADTRASGLLIAGAQEALEPDAASAARDRLLAGIANALWLIGDPAAEPVLLKPLTDESDEVRIAAARALGTCGTRECVPPLIDRLQSEIAPVRMQAASSLGKLGAVTATSALLAAITDPSWWVRSNAARALGELGEPGAVALQRAVAGPDRFAAQRAQEELMFLGYQT